AALTASWQSNQRSKSTPETPRHWGRGGIRAASVANWVRGRELLLSILQRQFVREVLKTTLLALVALSASLTLIAVAAEVYENEIRVEMAVRLIPFLLPSVLPYTLPIGLLIGCTLVYAHSASNLELAALKAGGISPLRVLWPSFMLGALVTGLSTYLADQ